MPEWSRAVVAALAITGLLVLVSGCGGGGADESAVRDAIQRATATTASTAGTPAPGGADAGGGSVPTVPAGGAEVDTSSGELPDRWPEDFPIPEGATVEYTATTPDGHGHRVLSATLTLPHTRGSEVQHFYAGALHDAGFHVLDEGGVDAGSALGATITFEAGDYDGNVIISQSHDDVALVLTVTPPVG